MIPKSSPQCQTGPENLLRHRLSASLVPGRNPLGENRKWINATSLDQDQTLQIPQSLTSIQVLNIYLIASQNRVANGGK